MKSQVGLVLIAACLATATTRFASAQLVSTNISVADAFVRSLDPTNNYGGAGALSVSGAVATNVLGQQQGLLDTFMRFDVSGTVSNLNNAFGIGRWAIVRTRLYLFEQGAPNNVIFNRGVGSFEVRWIANDSWQEGTGNPNAPTTNGVVWADEPSLLNSNVDQSLGSFMNGGTDGVVRLSLATTSRFLTDLTTNGLVSLFLTTATNSPVGFTFHSHNFIDTNQYPFLEIAAVSIPQVTSLSITGTNVRIGFDTSSNVTNIVESINDIAGTNWNALGSLLGTGGNTNFIDIGGATNRPSRFYRVRVNVPP